MYVKNVENQMTAQEDTVRTQHIDESVSQGGREHISGYF